MSTTTEIPEQAERRTNVVALRPRTEQPDIEQPTIEQPAIAAVEDDGIVVSDDADAPEDDHGIDTQAEHASAKVAQLRPLAPKAEPSNAPLEHQVEALLFVSPTPLTTAQLAELTDQDEDDLHECLVDMMQAWGEGSRGIVLERVAGGWALRASDRCREQLGKLVRPQGDTRLSPSAIETLAIVSYLQPVSRPDVAKIRGVSVDAAMTGLLERGMVEEAGRSDSGAVLFRTTAHFERAFGLSSLGALPELEGFGPGEDEIARMRDQLERMAEARVE